MSFHNRFPWYVDDFILDQVQLRGGFYAAERLVTQALMRDWLLRSAAGGIREGINPGGCIATPSGADRTISFSGGWGVQVNGSPIALFETDYDLGASQDGLVLTIPTNTTGSDRGDIVQAQIQKAENTPANVKHRSPTTPFAQGTEPVNTVHARTLVLEIKEGVSPSPPSPDAGWFVVYSYTVPNGFATADQGTFTRSATVELLIQGSQIEPFVGTEVGYVHIGQSDWETASSLWDFVQDVTDGKGIGTPGFWENVTLGGGSAMMAVVPTVGLEGCTFDQAQLQYDAVAIPGPDSEKAFFNTIKVIPGVSSITHTELSTSSSRTITSTGIGNTPQILDQNNVVANIEGFYIVIARGPTTGSTGDKLYSCRLRYNRPSGGFQP